MKNNNKNNIRLFNRVSDVALATIILGIAMMVFGLSMIAGSTISMARGYSLISSSSSLLFFALLHGISFVADGVLLATFCILVATVSPLSIRMRVLYIAGTALTAFNALNLILGIALKTNGFGYVVSVAGLAISAMIVLLTRKLIMKTKEIVVAQSARVVYGGLKKVG